MLRDFCLGKNSLSNSKEMYYWICFTFVTSFYMSEWFEDFGFMCFTMFLCSHMRICSNGSYIASMLAGFGESQRRAISIEVSVVITLSIL
jgi:hypothetical protein